MSLMNEMLQELERQAERKRGRRGPMIDAYEAEAEYLDERSAESSINHEFNQYAKRHKTLLDYEFDGHERHHDPLFERQSRTRFEKNFRDQSIYFERKRPGFLVWYGIAFFVLTFWVWLLPKQAEKAALYGVHGLEDLHTLFSKAEKKENLFLVEAKEDSVFQAKEAAHKTIAGQDFLEKAALKEAKEIAPSILPDKKNQVEINKEVALIVKEMAENVVNRAKNWDQEKEEVISFFSMPFLKAELRDENEDSKLENVEIESAPGHMRLRLIVNGAVEQFIEKNLDGRHINVVLPKTKLNNAIPPLVNADAPIVGLQAASRLGDLVLLLELKNKTAMQSSVIPHSEGTELVLDFINNDAQEVELPVMSSSSQNLAFPKKQAKFLPPLPPIMKEEEKPVIEAIAPTSNMIAPSDFSRMRISPRRTQNLDVEGKLSVALRAMSTGNIEEARTLLEENIRLYPRHAKSIATLSDLLLQEGDEANAKEVLNLALKRLPHHPLLIKKMAEFYRKDGKAEEALALLKKITPRFVDDPDYHGMLAALYQQQGHHHEAKDIYQKLVQYHPDEGMWWMGLALSQEAEGDPIAALKSYEQAQAKQNLDNKLLDFVNTQVKKLTKS